MRLSAFKPIELETGEDPEAPLIAAVARGNQDAFVTLFDRTAIYVAAEAKAHLLDPRQQVAVLAATFIEVWWTSGCRDADDPDVRQWMGRILSRRIAGAHRAAAMIVGDRPSPSEIELSGLLGRPAEQLWPG